MAVAVVGHLADSVAAHAIREELPADHLRIRWRGHIRMNFCVLPACEEPPLDDLFIVGWSPPGIELASWRFGRQLENSAR